MVCLRQLKQKLEKSVFQNDSGETIYLLIYLLLSSSIFLSNHS